MFTSCMSFAFMDTEHALAQVQTYIYICGRCSAPGKCLCSRAVIGGNRHLAHMLILPLNHLISDYDRDYPAGLFINLASQSAPSNSVALQLVLHVRVRGTLPHCRTQEQMLCNLPTLRWILISIGFCVHLICGSRPNRRRVTYCHCYCRR